MGTTYSFLEAEKKTWIEHTLVYDEPVRVANLKYLEDFKDGSNIFLSYMHSGWGNKEFEHWFVTNGTQFLEFGSVDVNIYNARVTINTHPRQNYPIDVNDVKSCRPMNENMRHRMRHVIGLSNYSLCLRNCEHVANYVFRGRWISSQMDDHGDGGLIQYFRSYMLDNRKRLINTFPVPIRSQLAITDTCESLYSFIADNYTFSRVEYYLDYEDDTYNVLVVGPTGAGKSHLINVFFNQNICESDVSHRSVTKEIVFVRGRGKVYNPEKEIYQERSIVVADTIGLCDTEWEDTKVINLIRNRVSSNLKHIDAVYVVFRADRLLKEHVANIQHILKWLGYQTGLNCLRFLFVGTYADYISTEKKDALRAEATTMFQLKDTSRKIAPTGHSIQSLVYTRFPPEDSLNEMTKEKTQQCWRELRVLLNHPGVCDRIPLDQGSSCAIL